MHKFIYLSFLIQVGYYSVTAVVNECQTKLDCSACISFKPTCAWCEDVIYKAAVKSYHKKCDSVANHAAQNCKNVSNPQSNFENTKDSKLEGDVRVSPQEIKIRLRPGQPKTVPVRVKTPINFPMDLYYLMDLSKSMEDDLSQIRDIGDKLGKQLKEVTTNFRLGFGGYVDKATGPYTKTGQVDIDGILNRNTNMQYTFGYRNYLPLTEVASRFEETVNKVKISFNVDFPEGSLEALMQVIVCRTDIGWRNKKKARRIVIVTTDATFHYSGDGLLGGFVRPNDGQCHMVNDTYTAWDKFDYPSLSQVRSYLSDNDIVPIFATTGNEELYKTVAKFFGNGAQADKLNKDSSNVVPLIKKAYERIARTVTIDTTPPTGIKVNFAASCGKQGKRSGPQCDDIEIGEEVTFDVTMVAETCEIENPNFIIKTSFDDVNVTLELICECDCGDITVNATECTSRGNLSCGMCFCDKNLYGGRFCHCTAKEAKNETLCKVPGSDKAICNGRGTCDCGECICDPPKLNENGDFAYFYGEQCQCSNATCGRSNGGQICGGEDRGLCDCGSCKCSSDWTGRTCNEECSKSTEQCFNKDDVLDRVCTGKGTCECNKCKCDDGYIGDHCTECVEDCPDPCRDYRECVKCRVFETSDLTPEECDAECAKMNITSHLVVDKVEDESRCLERDEDDCSFVFTYKKDNITDDVTLIVQRDRICPAEPDILAIILGVIAGIVGIGLALLLIWKLLATIQDRREFAKFQNDVHNPKWDSGENPIYKKATSTFQNPMYGEKAQEAEPGTALIE